MAIRDADIKLLFGKNVTVGESINENIANPSQIETGFDILWRHIWKSKSTKKFAATRKLSTLA